MATAGGRLNTFTDFQSKAGPGDSSLRNNELEGYAPQSRIGEVVINSVVDGFEWGTLKPSITRGELKGAGAVVGDPDEVVEYRPAFAEWATAMPGCAAAARAAARAAAPKRARRRPNAPAAHRMIAVSRKKRSQVFRNYTFAETAVPVVVCAACLPKAQESAFFFAGVVRSKSIRAPDDGIGPQSDEFFTLALGGMSTLLNTSGGAIHPGDLLAWTFSHEKTHNAKRAKTGPRRIGITKASVSSPNIFARALSFAKSGEQLDVLIKQ